MTLTRTKAGWYEGDFRAKGVTRLHLALGTKNRKVAEPRHAAVHKLFRQKRVEMIEQLRSGVLTVERLEAMVEHHEPLTTVATEQAHGWGTVDDCADRYLTWIDSHPKRAEKTKKVARWQLSGFRAFTVNGQTIGSMLLDDVTSDLIMAYQRSLVDSGVPPNSITTMMARVGGLWRFVRRDEERLAQAKRRVPRPVYTPVDPEMVIRDIRRRDRFLTEDELARLFAATPARARFPVYCGAMAGLRVDEMLHLRPGVDVDLDMGALTITDQPEWKPKTRRSRRVVPMTSALREAAASHAASESWMMPSVVTPTRPLTQAGWRVTFKAIVERAGLIFGQKTPQGVTFHTLRHTFASHAVMRGVDLYTVAQLLGDSLATVEATYAHLSPDHKKAAIRKLEAAFKMPQPATQKGDSE